MRGGGGGGRFHCLSTYINGNLCVNVWAKSLHHLPSYGVYEAGLSNPCITCHADIYFDVFPAFEGFFHKFFQPRPAIFFKIYWNFFHVYVVHTCTRRIADRFCGWLAHRICRWVAYRICRWVAYRICRWVAYRICRWVAHKCCRWIADGFCRWIAHTFTT